MKKVDGWQTDDGIFFGDEQEALDHEAFEKLKQFCIDADIKDDDENRAGAALILWRHRARVIEILRHASTPTELEKLSS